ncbi:MAG TPA: imelysin family protein, partial [Acidothermaceae bacterium]
KAGDIEGAKAAYGPARTHYESIEPVAESFGDLDPTIDARENDVVDQREPSDAAQSDGLQGRHPQHPV